MPKFNFKKIGMKAIGVSAGAIGAKVLDKPLANLNPTLRGGLKIVGGALLSSFIKGEMMENIGSGLIAVGAVDLAGNFAPGLVSGIGETSEYIYEDEDYLSGAEESALGESEETESALGESEETESALGDIGYESYGDENSEDI